MGDPITHAEQERAALLEELAEADEQAEGWRDRRKDLIINAAALNISHREIARYVSLSDRGIGKMIRRERARAGVESGQSKT
jgi:hypothetical protein